MSGDEFDPVRADALVQVFEQLPQRSGTRRPAARVGAEAHYETVMHRTVTVVVAVGVLVGVVAVLQAVQPRSPAGISNAHPRPTSPPSSTITDHGVELRYAGVVPWRSAIRATDDSRTLSIQGDGDQVHGVGRICNGTDAQRVKVHETPTTIEILVRGYAAPQKFAGAVCFGVGHRTVSHTVRLKEPIGRRTLIDLSNRTEHSVLTDADVPKALAIPTGFVDRGPSWDDRFPGVSRDYSSTAATESDPEHFLVEIAPTGSFDRLDRPYWGAGPATVVHGETAEVWRHSDIYNVNTLIEWQHGNVIYRVTTFGTPGEHLTEQQVITIAHSVELESHSLPAVTR